MKKSEYSKDVKNLVALQRFGILSTISAQESGFPFGSVVPYDLDTQGNLIIYISLIAEHFKNLVKDPRASICIWDPAGTANPQAYARATLLLNFAKVPEGEAEEVQKRFLERFPDSVDFSIAHNFVFMRGSVHRVRWIGGFGEIGWVSKEDFNSEEVEPIAYQGLPILQHMNRDHKDALADLVKAHTDVDLSSAELYMNRISKSDFSIAAHRENADEVITIAFDKEVQTPEEARVQIIEKLKQARQSLAN